MTKKNILFFISAAIILAAGILFWSADLNSDPPMYYSGLGQSLSTDPAYYTYHARNKILTGKFDPLNDTRWTLFQHSITSLTAVIVYKLFGVSMTSSNITGLVLSLLGLIIFLSALYKRHKRWVVLITALLFLSNLTLMTYGRLSYLENGLIFYSALIFFIYTRWPDKTYAIASASAVCALAMLTGKMFGALLFPALAVSVFFSHQEDRFKKILIGAGSFIVSTIGLVFILFGSNFAQAFGFVSEQSYGVRGFPKGLSTPWDFIEHFISFGAGNRLFYNNFDLLVILLLAVFILTLFRSNGSSLKSLPVTTRFALFWFIIGFTALMPLNYSPLRYSLFLIPAIFILGVTSFEILLNTPKARKNFNSVKYFIPIMVVFWMFLYHLTVLLFYSNFPPTRTIVWATLPIATGVVFVVFKYLTRFIQLYSIKTRYIIITFALLTVIGSNINLSIEKKYQERNYTISEASFDLGQILGDKAVLSGSYAPTMTQNNNLKAHIHFFGLLDNPPDLFEKTPVTHLAVDISNRNRAFEVYPRLKDLKPITTYWIRDYEISIYNIAHIFGNYEADSYQESGYERAVNYIAKNDRDSAYIVLEEFILSNSNSKSANLLMANILIGMGQQQRGMLVLITLAGRYPTDSYLNLICGQTIQRIGVSRNDQYLIFLSQKYYEQAVKANPYRGEYANNIYAQILKKLDKS